MLPGRAGKWQRVLWRAATNVLAAAILAAAGYALAAPRIVAPAAGQFSGQIPGPVPRTALVEEAPVVAFRNEASATLAVQVMHVPIGEIENWLRYCEKYEACTVPVNFVSEAWFQQSYLTQENSQDDGSAQSYLIDQQRDNQDARAQNHRHSKPEQ